MKLNHKNLTELNHKNLTELNHTNLTELNQNNNNKNNSDDKITLTILIPGYKFLIYKKVIENISSSNNEILSEHFPELNIK